MTLACSSQVGDTPDASHDTLCPLAAAEDRRGNQSGLKAARRPKVLVGDRFDLHGQVVEQTDRSSAHYGAQVNLRISGLPQDSQLPMSALQGEYSCNSCSTLPAIRATPMPAVTLQVPHRVALHCTAYVR